MHGQPRKASSSKTEDAASIAKAAKLRNLQSQLLHNHHNKIFTKEALETSSKLLELNPEIYTGWNYRKLAFEHNLHSEIDPEAIQLLVNDELRLVENALTRNCKSYGAWHHRKWILSQGLSSCDHEFHLLNKLQKADPRNFHAWNYRRFVSELKNVSEEEELKYTTDMIETNFSNYSAWHNRSVILSDLLRRKAQGFISKEKVLTEEYGLVLNALFVDPRDQSGWFYHLWLLEQTVIPDAPVLVSTWPSHCSDLIVSFERKSDGFVLPTFTTFHSNSGTFPLILYFSQSVEGVSSSTISVNFMFCKEDLIWSPLSSNNNSKKAYAWVTYLKFPDKVDNSSKAYPVEVSVGHSQGIISSSGSDYSFPSQFTFTVNLQCTESESLEGNTGKDLLNWEDECFHSCEKLSSDLNPLLPFDQLRISKNHEPKVSKWLIETLLNEIAQFRELLLEDNCKIGKLTLARLLRAHDAIMSYNTPSEYEKVNSEEVLELFSDLMKLDPPHSGYYKDEHSTVLMEQVISKRKSLTKHCFYYGESSPSNICLRLNNISLSKIGSFEHLLWVRMLDLSHNELQSIEGLEAMQLLSCLNLSYNRFRSFTALQPLRLLQSLKVLDISHNEIGLHPVDTTRYLCPSPLSHSVREDCKFDDYATGSIRVADSWEAVSTLRGLQLIQLDIVGNAFCNDDFRLLLVKLLPKLKWLDRKVVH